MSDSREWAQLAALAVGEALRPAARAKGQRRYGVQPLREPIFAAMTSGGGGYASVWFEAHGAGLIDALGDLTGVDEATASYFVGASMYALTTCQQDLTPHAVLQLAERAVFWHQGAEYAASAKAATA